MTPLQFVERWRDSELRERQGSQMHFLELCDLLGEPRPAPSDGGLYCFERGAEKAGGGDGWADVFRRHKFAWEYKGKHKDLKAALRQLQTYTLDLEMPPYLIVSDMDQIIVHTNWNNTVSVRHPFALDDLLDAGKRDLLKQVFNGSDRLKPTISPQELTATVAQRFGDIGRRLQDRKHDPRTVAHFLNRLVFCMFAEDARLLPNMLFTRMMKAVQTNPAAASTQLSELFAKMHKGGFFGVDEISWFNGGLFDGEDVLPLEVIDLKEIAKTADEHDWSQIDPAIFGSLFEQALKATRERPALGAHYTDREKILKIVDPVITRPLMAEWEIAHAEIAELMAAVHAADAAEKGVREEAAAEMAVDPKKAKAGEEARRKRTTGIKRERNKAYAAAQARLDLFLDRLAHFRVLDPACGSGNFLYVALHALHDIERRAHGDVLRLGLEPPTLRVSVKQLRGIEIERYAAELARVTLWIGDLQWRIKNGYLAFETPILAALDQIEERDALLDAQGALSSWPDADVIIGNPPFLGATRFLREIGEEKVAKLRAAFNGLVPPAADFVSYWFCLAKRVGVDTKRVGFVGTASVRHSATNKVVQEFAERFGIYEAWSNEPWAVAGAAVRVSVICGSCDSSASKWLNGKQVEQITSQLNEHEVSPLPIEGQGDSIFRGPPKIGDFDVSGDVAREWLKLPSNPNGKTNSSVVRPIWNAYDIVRRHQDRWIVDFDDMTREEAELFEAPFAHVNKHVRPFREHNRRAWRRENWWQHGETVPALRQAMAGRSCVIVTPMVSKHRVFLWMPCAVLPDQRLMIIASDSDAIFGILSSAAHTEWSLATCSWHGVGDDPVYNAGSVFETFPFPDGLTPNLPPSTYANDPRAIAIASAARELNEKREAWLNPPEWVDRVPEVVPGYPDRIVPKNEDAAEKLKQRTLTKLYNERPAWLDNLHKNLDAAVAAAYGWPADLSDEQILEKLFALNQERAAAGR